MSDLRLKERITQYRLKQFVLRVSRVFIVYKRLLTMQSNTS